MQPQAQLPCLRYWLQETTQDPIIILIENMLCLFFTVEAASKTPESPVFCILSQIIIRFSAFKSKLQAFRAGL